VVDPSAGSPRPVAVPAGLLASGWDGRVVKVALMGEQRRSYKKVKLKLYYIFSTILFSGPDLKALRTLTFPKKF